MTLHHLPYYPTNYALHLVGLYESGISWYVPPWERVARNRQRAQETKSRHAKRRRWPRRKA